MVHFNIDAFCTIFWTMSSNYERELRRLVENKLICYKFAALEIFQGMNDRICPQVHFTHIYRYTSIMYCWNIQLSSLTIVVITNVLFQFILFR